MRPSILGYQTPVSLAHLWPEKRVIHPTFRFIDVKIGGHDVVVACQNYGRAAIK